MRVLIACEESQRVCIAFREKGHEAYSCDLIDQSGGHPEWHIKGDCTRIIDGNCNFITGDGKLYTLIGQWDLIIAHPPCTYLSKASACRMYKIIDGVRYINAERYQNMKEAKQLFMRIMNAKCKRIAIENPLPLKICELPYPSQIIQPYEYGDPYRKQTLLWLKNLPILKPTNIVNPIDTWIPSNTSGNAQGKGGSCGASKQNTRSRTFKGIAKAMADQWGGENNAE